MSKWSAIQTSHEIRQWVKLLALGGIALAAYLDRHPEQRERFNEWLKRTFK